jgi:hypothetical protein
MSMGSTRLVILLVAVAFFVVIGLGATGNLLDQAKLSSDTANAAQGVTGVMSPLWMVFIAGILIVGAYALIHAYSSM